MFSPIGILNLGNSQVGVTCLGISNVGYLLFNVSFYFNLHSDSTYPIVSGRNPTQLKRIQGGAPCV